MKTIFLAATAAVALLGAGSANALTFLIAYSSSGAAPLTLNATVTTADVLNSVGGYDVLSITGNVSGDVITGLTPNPNQPNAAGSPDGLFNYDNVFFTTAPYVSGPGLLFTSAAFEYNFFSDDANTYELYQAANGGYTANSVGTLAVTQVPEPATWGLMIAGFAMTGLAAAAARPSSPRNPGE